MTIYEINNAIEKNAERGNRTTDILNNNHGSTIIIYHSEKNGYYYTLIIGTKLHTAHREYDAAVSHAVSLGYEF